MPCCLEHLPASLCSCASFVLDNGTCSLGRILRLEDATANLRCGSRLPETAKLSECFPSLRFAVKFFFVSQQFWKIAWKEISKAAASTPAKTIFDCWGIVKDTIHTQLHALGQFMSIWDFKNLQNVFAFLYFMLYHVVTCFSEATGFQQEGLQSEWSTGKANHGKTHGKVKQIGDLYIKTL